MKNYLILININPKIKYGQYNNFVFCLKNFFWKKKKIIKTTWSLVHYKAKDIGLMNELPL